MLQQPGTTRRGVDTQRFRMTLAALASGVTVITTCGEHPYGVTATAVSSLSLEPPLVLVCMRRDGRAAREIATNRRFVVNILASDQEATSRRFASPDRPQGAAALFGVPHRLSENGSPVLDGVVAFVDCVLADSHEAGDHIIFVGEVRNLGGRPGAPPLVLHGGRYRSLA